MNNSVYFAFTLTLLAGLSTGFGSLISVLTKRTDDRILSLSLGFSSGVMIYISFMELFSGAMHDLSGRIGTQGGWMAAGAFFFGMAISAGIDRLVPNHENPHEIRKVEEMAAPARKDRGVMRLGIVSAVVIAVHNFPEGLATFAAALKSSQTGYATALAIAIHNIPEGISIAVPIYAATASRKKAFFLSFASGLAEPAGAIIGYLLLKPLFYGPYMSLISAGVAGIMIFIAFDELLPAAHEYGEHHIAIGGLISGMVIMAASLLFFS